jgi:hypothetical protein
MGDEESARKVTNICIKIEMSAVKDIRTAVLFYLNILRIARDVVLCRAMFVVNRGFNQPPHSPARIVMNVI